MSHRLSIFLKSRKLLKNAFEPPPPSLEPSWPAIFDPSCPAIFEPSWPAILEPSWPAIFEPSCPAIFEPSGPTYVGAARRSSNLTPEGYLYFDPGGASGGVSGSTLRMATSLRYFLRKPVQENCLRAACLVNHRLS